jgi:glycosyltransferase involved in cell wall biosynthesis
MRLSIAMCTYNGGSSLREQLTSVLTQGRLPDELVICDDGSTDCTVEIVREFQAAAPFEVQLIVNDKKLGSTKNFEKCIQLCKGDIIVLSDQDDSWQPDRLRLSEEVFLARPDAGAVFSDALIVDDNLEPMGYNLCETAHFGNRLKQKVAAGKSFEALLAHNVVTGATMAFRVEFRPLVIPIPAIWVHDGWIAILISAVANVIYIDKPLVKYRQHSTQQLGARKRSIAIHMASAWANDNREAYKTFPQQYRFVRDRLEQVVKTGLPAWEMTLLEEKIRHLNLRAELKRSHIARVPAILKEFAFGRYGRFGYGWRGAVRDLVVNLAAKPEGLQE